MKETSIMFLTILTLAAIVGYLCNRNLRKVAESLESIKYNMLESNIKTLETIKKKNAELELEIERLKKYKA